MTEIVLRFAPSERDEQLFTRLRRSLDRLVDEGGDLETVILQETWRLVGCLGFAPSLDPCGVCGRPPSPDSDCFFYLAEGTLVCATCRAGAAVGALRVLPADARAELKTLLSGGHSNGRLRTSRFQRTLLRDFIAYHVTDERPLNSFRFLDDRLG